MHPSSIRSRANSGLVLAVPLARAFHFGALDAPAMVPIASAWTCHRRRQGYSPCDGVVERASTKYVGGDGDGGVHADATFWNHQWDGC
jgi:hypothetical protein